MPADDFWEHRGGGVLFLHAHPDDETLTSGPVLALLAERGIPTALVTATRGERGEVASGMEERVAQTGDLATHREHELAAACDALGVAQHWFLGSVGARANGRAPRRYVDSGMRWISPGLAGPDASAGPDALISTDLDEQVADLCAVIDALRPSVLVGDPPSGGYGHPDHVRCHAILTAAAHQTGIRTVVVDPRSPGPGSHVVRPASDVRLRRALRAHRSQFTLDGAEIVHCGGQREPVRIETRVRPLDVIDAHGAAGPSD